MGNEEKQPEGGLDRTPLHPTKGTTYTVKITFHRATDVPISDFGKRSSDPYILAQINTSLPQRHSNDPHLRYRTHTVHASREPKWNLTWVVAGIPESGFTLKARLYDEDPQDHDDRLGKLRIDTGRIDEKYARKDEVHKMQKKGSDPKTYALRWCTTMIKRHQNLHVRLTISIEVIGKTEEEIGKAYTLNCFWWTHQSPMIGRLTGTKADQDDGVTKVSFQSNEMQMLGPVPPELYHRYVEFKPFVAGMFQGKGVRGFLLHKALHHQHERIYIFDPKTKYGRFEDGPGEEMTIKFLKMAHFDQGGRVFTYVLTLDGMFRFTETGKEFGIDLLSKHTMHSDVNIYIAWSGEFFIRRLKNPNESADDPDQETHPPKPVEGGPPKSDPPKDPRLYELIIDNDSGTYRPDKSLLPVLKKFLEKNLPGLQVKVKACDDEKLKKMKSQQLKVKKEEGDHMIYQQGSDSGSISSSDASSLASRAGEDENEIGDHQGMIEKGVAALERPKEAIKSALT